MEVRTLIENNQVGGIIGKGGSNVQRIREETGATLSILKTQFRNVADRVMVLKGNLSQIAMACSHVVQSDKKEFDQGEEQQVVMRFLVHRSSVGALIGKGGATIRETQANTGVRMQISNEPLPNSTEKSVTVTGTPSAIHSATLTILRQLHDNPLRGNAKLQEYVPGQPQYAPNPYGMPMGGMPMGGMAEGYAQPQMYGQIGQIPQQQYGGVPPQAAPSSTQKIAIPTVCAGCVIGKGGSVIRSLREQSRTNISIADPEADSPNERVVTLTGTPQGIQTAVYLIRQLVEQYQPQPQY